MCQRGTLAVQRCDQNCATQAVRVLLLHVSSIEAATWRTVKKGPINHRSMALNSSVTVSQLSVCHEKNLNLVL